MDAVTLYPSLDQDSVGATYCIQGEVVRDRLATFILLRAHRRGTKPTVQTRELMAGVSCEERRAGAELGEG